MLKDWRNGCPLMVVSKRKAFYATPVSISELSYSFLIFFTSCSRNCRPLFKQQLSFWSHCLWVTKNPPLVAVLNDLFSFVLLYRSLSCSPPSVASSLFLATQAKTHWLWCLWKPRKERMLWKISFTTRVMPAPASMEIDLREIERKLCISSGLDVAPS